jgi:hypothetical protein
MFLDYEKGVINTAGYCFRFPVTVGKDANSTCGEFNEKA